LVLTLLWDTEAGRLYVKVYKAEQLKHTKEPDGNKHFTMAAMLSTAMMVDSGI